MCKVFKKLLFVSITFFLIASAFTMPVFRFQDGNCPNSPARLKQGDIAVVTVDNGETLNLRVRPNVNAERITKIPAYTYITIIAGPICDGGYRWYEVGFEGKDGWSAEVGPDGEYNMMLNGQPVPNSNSTPSALIDDLGNKGMRRDPNCNYDPGYCPSGDCSPQLYQYTSSDNLQVYIVVDCQLRKIQTDSTLKALGIRNVYSLDLPSTLDLNFPFGTDIPFADGEEVEFCAFKNEYFRPVKPVDGALDCSSIMLPQIIEPPSNTTAQPTDTPQPLVEAPIETIASEEPFYCNWWVVGWLACDLAEANSAQAWCEPQCMTLMRRDEFRPDMNLWSKGTGDSTPLDVLANAEKEVPYNDPPKTGPLMQVRVRESTEQPEAGDLIIWQNGCGRASNVGHIGKVVSSSGITVNITDSNWDKKCGPRTDVQIQILPCMRFVTEPFPAGTYVPTVQPAVINCDDYQGWQNFACNYIPWWKP